MRNITHKITLTNNGRNERKAFASLATNGTSRLVDARGNMQSPASASVGELLANNGGRQDLEVAKTVAARIAHRPATGSKEAEKARIDALQYLLKHARYCK